MLLAIGPEVRRRREAAGLSLRSLARLERAEREPRLSVLYALATALSCDLTDLLDP
jgi:transcriptional regulator with XRE-family HTH domain